jgi:general secretion pathway protein J
MEYQAIRDRRTGGFTLLELLVMLTVAGLLMVTITQGLRLGSRARAVAARLQTNHAELEATARVVRQLIAHASPGDPSSRAPPFFGAPHAASFITTLPSGFGASASGEAEVSLEVGPGNRLELRWRPHYRRWIAAAPPLISALLLDGVDHLDLAFWQPTPGSTGGFWASAWSAPDPPALVRVRVVFPPGDGRRWPDIIAAQVRERPL